MRAICGKKKIMTRIFDETGRQVPVTLIKVDPNTVIQIKDSKKDGYKAVQLGAGTQRRLTKPLLGHVAKANVKPKILFEIKTNKDYKVGDKVTLENFQEKEKVNVSGISLGKGFAGTVKRHGFKTGPKTHGSNNYRQPGSIGATGPQRVVKGRRMAGHLGAKKATVKNLEIFKIDKESGLIFLCGAVPGKRESEIFIWSNSEN